MVISEELQKWKLTLRQNEKHGVEISTSSQLLPRAGYKPRAKTELPKMEEKWK